MARVPISEQVQVNFRLPLSLRDRIKTAAERNGQSMNAELIDALQRAFPEPMTAQEVVADIADLLGFYDANLRHSAIELLGATATDGRLRRWADVAEIIERNRDDR